MILYVNEKGEIKDVNETKDKSLTAIDVKDDPESNPFIGWSTAKICCYRVQVCKGSVTMMTPYVDSRLIEHINKLGNGVEYNSNEIDASNEALNTVMVEVIPEQAAEVASLSEMVDSILTEIIPRLSGE